MPPADGAPRAVPFARHVRLVVAKDLLVEWRSREVIYTMLFFAVLVVVIFSFAFARDGQPMHQVAGGILWVVVVFAGTLGLGRVFHRELEGNTRVALMLSPAPPAAIYLGKLLGVVLLMALVEVVVVGLLLLLFGLAVSSFGLLLALLAAGTVGFAAVGCLFAATLMQSRARDMLLGLITYPIVIPVVVAGAKGTAALLASPGDAASALVWLKVLAMFDITFVTLSLWAFGPLTRGE